MTIIEPNLPSNLYTTFGIIAPKRTHTRPATCAEVECEAMKFGWMTKVDVGTDIGVQRARYIIDHSERHWTSQQNGGLVTFTFPPGQKCFAEHRVTLERDPIFTMKKGHIGDAYARAEPVSTDQWMDRFGSNQERLKSIIEGA